jgi:iron complex outermembrane receptor protein
MKKILIFSFSILVFILFSFNASLAEEFMQREAAAGFETFDLGEIYVTAEKMPASKEVTVTTEITAEEIKATNSRTVAEALTYVPGVIVSVGRKNEPNVQIRGLDQSRTLILIDGVPYYETNFGKLDLNQIPADNVAKIEITKGAASVLYGPNALAGVINIITKKPAKKLSFDTLAEIGENGTYKLSLSNGMKSGIFNYWLNYSHDESDGWRMSDDFVPREGTLKYRPGSTLHPTFEDGGFRNNSDFNRDSFWAKFGMEPKDGEYYINFHYINREKGMPPNIDSNSVFQYPDNQYSQLARITRYDDWGIDLSGQQKVFEQLILKGKLFYHNHVDDYTSFSDTDFQNAYAVSRFKDYFIGGSITTDYRPVDWDIVRLSFVYRGDSHKERDLPIYPFAEVFSYTGSVGLENEFNKVKNLSVVIGASYDWFKVTDAKGDIIDEDTGNFLGHEKVKRPDTMDELNPMIGAIYTFSDSTRIFGSVAKKIRFPLLQYLFFGSSSNPDLNAEKSINYTLGISRVFNNIITAQFAFFYHDISDYITRDTSDPLNRYLNFQKVSLTGFELTGEITPMSDLSITAGYTYNNARNRSDERLTDHLFYIPENKLDLGIHYTVPYIKTLIDLTAIYVDNAYSSLPYPGHEDNEIEQTSDYFIMNARISKTFLKNYEAYLAVNNIFDTNYEPETGYPAPGRNFYVGVSAKF